MKPHPKPVVVISKCLGFDKCRYNGQTIPSKAVENLKPFVEYIPVCPEVEIGLGVPRDPIRIVLDNGEQKLTQPATGANVTLQMNRFVDDFLNKLKQVDGFILKNRSPSCGIYDVKQYNGFDKSASSSRGNGFFGQAVLDRYSGYAIEDEGRLLNFTIREHYLTKLFTFTRFRQVKEAAKMAALVDFHTQHKYLLLAYNQAAFRRCGRIVANHEKLKITEVNRLYEEELKLVLKHTPKTGPMINTLQHVFGYVSKELSGEEKKFFMNAIEEYRDERIPLSTVTHLLYSYALRFNAGYLLDQVLFEPYPKDLVAITDSGKGRNY